MQMGRILLVQKKEKEALARFEKALSLQPNYIEPLQYIVLRVHEQEGIPKSL